MSTVTIAPFDVPNRKTIAQGQQIRFQKALIASGSRPAVPNMPGLSNAHYLTNETVFELTELPRRLICIGGGIISCELAQAFCRLGSEVDLIGSRNIY